MKKYKTVMKFIIALIFLVLIPLVPMSISKYNDDQLVDRFRVENIKKDDNKDIQTNDLSVVEKLELITNYGNTANNIIVTSQVEDMSEQNIDAIREVINQQLKVLQSLGILMEFTLDDSYKCNEYVIKRYSDVIDAKQSVSLYQVSFIGDGNFFQVCLDKETNKIFQFEHYDKKYSIDDDDIIVSFGVDYLGLSKDEARRYFISDYAGKKIAVNISQASAGN